MRQDVRFCTAPDGVRLGFATSGSGPPIVKAGHWLTHLERDWESPVWRHWLEFLTHRHTLVRYDERGCGLSDRRCDDVSLDAWVRDLETVIDAADCERFTLLGLCQGGPAAVAYASRHPDRVQQLILFGTYLRGRLNREPDDTAAQEAEALVSLTRVGWGRPAPAYRRLFTSLFIPGGTEEQMAWFDELQRQSCSPDHASRARAVKYGLDVTPVARTLTVPTLVLHARNDALVPLAEAKFTASTIPDARLVTFESANHILLEDEPAWAELRDVLLNELPARSPPPTDGIDLLSAREHEVLALVSQGLDNETIADALAVSSRTVERHLSNSYAKLGLTGKAARAAAAAIQVAATMRDRLRTAPP